MALLKAIDFPFKIFFLSAKIIIFKRRIFVNKFTIEECFSFAFQLGKKSYAEVLVRFLITIVLSVIAGFTIIGILLVPALIAGLYKFLIRSARGESKGLMDSWKYGFQNGMWWKSLLLTIISALGILIGYLFLIIPGIYLSVAWLLVWFLIVDKDISVTESFGKSRALVHSLGFWRVFGVHILTAIGFQVIALIPFVNILGFFAIPFYLMLYVAIYEKAIQDNPSDISEPSYLSSNV